jgi:hypothetical protein
MSVIVKILREITKGFSVYHGSLDVVKNKKFKRYFCNFPKNLCYCVSASVPWSMNFIGKLQNRLFFSHFTGV